MRILIPFAAAAGICLLASGLAGERSFAVSKKPLSIPLARMAASVFLFFSVGFVTLGLTQVLTLSLIVGVGAAAVPFLVHASRRRRRSRASRAQWPDVIQDLVSIVRSGASLPEAWIRLGQRNFPGISEHLVASTSVYRSTGSFALCLEDARSRLRDPIAEHVLLALKVTHEVGGTDLIPALRALADSVAADLATRQEVEARWSWTVSSARVAAAAPWLVLFVMLARPETARAYSTSGGAVVLFVAALMTVAGYLLMLRAARLPERGGA